MTKQKNPPNSGGRKKMKREHRADYQRLVYLIGQTMKARREDCRMQQSELASAVGISKSFLSDIEHARVLPSLETYLKLCNVLDLDLAFIDEK